MNGLFDWTKPRTTYLIFTIVNRVSLTTEMATPPVVVLDRGNNTTCTINLHGCTIVSWRVNNQEQARVFRILILNGLCPKFA